ncbi:ATP-binding cassette domain-containing protein [Bacteroides sp. 519]|uniref:ATP-binding cassette domain-containing protein n=1 Tax=Bacteroides sp. 519 TaxID=2302937 RepID=UPI0013D677D7|nr:ATP-binding cassette domain-containing protein [Bacteroides sp. 519]NDV57918.1 ATP-binding cassette domain-containing protein [Bacteroides sp. 519]
MEIIHLQQTLPEVFAGRSSINSDIWHKDVIFHKGETYLIEAASGTGKSSLCSFIYGYRTDYQGIITFDDSNIKTFSTQQWVNIRKESISMLFQDLRLFPELSVMENIQLKNNLTGFKKKKEIKDLLEQLGIPDKIKSKVGKLSFGQQQRVAFVRTLCQPCDFFMMDEPVSHLDDVNGEIMGSILQSEAGQQGAGIIITSIGKHIELPFNKVFKL